MASNEGARADASLAPKNPLLIPELLTRVLEFFAFNQLKRDHAFLFTRSGAPAQPNSTTANFTTLITNAF